MATQGAEIKIHFSQPAFEEVAESAAQSNLTIGQWVIDSIALYKYLIESQNNGARVLINPKKSTRVDQISF